MRTPPFWTAERIAHSIGEGCDCGWPEDHISTCVLNAREAGERGA